MCRIKEPEIINVRSLLQNRDIAIPDYQRPYKWTEKNVNQLIDDIAANVHKSSYRIGTLVIHVDENGKYNIVDGQQRTITMVLIALALLNEGKLKESINHETREHDFTPKFELRFINDISKKNIQDNYRTILRRINEFDEKTIWFFYEKCQMVQVILQNITEAFQFFDSQNARGKDLEPHDLLKAFHLREMSSVSEEEQTKIIRIWEGFDTKELADLFSKYLFRIRNWSKDKPARYFTKDDIDTFKGISPDVKENYPFACIFRIAHFYTDDYNQSVYSRINQHKLEFPFQIDQTIINGKRFFEMITHYKQLIFEIENRHDNEVFKLIRDYEGCNRVGDRYIRSLFYTGLTYYVDKFGYTDDFEKAVNKIFVWAYTLRLKLQNVGTNSVDNYALHKWNSYASVQIFKTIREATSPLEVLNMRLEVLTEEGKSTKTAKIKQQFKKLKYLL